jgi:tripeptide aminopeptidase
MVNAVRVVADVIARLPRGMAPETTEGREAYVHPYAVEGGVARATLKLSLRDFETAGLSGQRRLLEAIVREVARLHPGARLELEVKELYRNMRDGLARDPRVTAALEEATRRAGLAPRWEAIRGGTDGSKLTAMGLPTPNLFAGGQSFHGPTEWLSVDGMEASLATLRRLLEVWLELAATPRSNPAARARRRRAARPSGTR